MVINELQFSNIKWTDYQTPTKEKLIELAPQVGVPRGMLLSCLDPDFLPHLDTYNDVYFLMLRICEKSAPNKADTIQELTTKIAVFIKGNEIFSFHRLPLEELKNVTDKINDRKLTRMQDFLNLLFEEVILSYEKPLMNLEFQTDDFEEKILSTRRSKYFLRDGFMIKRKASAYRRVIKFTLDILNKSVISLHFDSNFYGYLKEKNERFQFFAESTFENIQGLLNLHIAIQSQKTNEASFRTNEIVRVLTVLTIFFLPLNFIAGVFGMNFDSMPLVKTEGGFWASMILMLLICLGLFIYTVRKGWLTPPKSE